MNIGVDAYVFDRTRRYEGPHHKGGVRAARNPPLRRRARMTSKSNRRERYVSNPAHGIGRRAEFVLERLTESDAYCFDVDSTITETEGLDEFGEWMGVDKGRIKELTDRAMDGNVRFEDSFRERLNLISPSRDKLNEYVRERDVRLTEGIRELIGTIRATGKSIYVVSGGLFEMIKPICEELGIAEEDIFANELIFDERGEYAGYDDRRPTSRSGGKGEVIRELRRQHGYRTVVMIGDGETDAESVRDGCATFFVGYGGVVERDTVKAKADLYVHSHRELIDMFDRGLHA